MGSLAFRLPGANGANKEKERGRGEGKEPKIPVLKEEESVKPKHVYGSAILTSAPPVH